MTDKSKTCEGGLNPSKEKTSTQQWLEDWIASASTEEKNKTKQWLEEWIASVSAEKNPKPNND